MLPTNFLLDAGAKGMLLIPPAWFSSPGLTSSPPSAERVPLSQRFPRSLQLAMLEPASCQIVRCASALRSRGAPAEDVPRNREPNRPRHLIALFKAPLIYCSPHALDPPGLAADLKPSPLRSRAAEWGVGGGILPGRDAAIQNT